MHNPAFHTKHYIEESSEMKMQRNIEAKFFTLIYFLNPKHWFNR